jgi:hypothetical protein
MNTDDVSRDLARAFPAAPGDLGRLHDWLLLLAATLLTLEAA